MTDPVIVLAHSPDSDDAFMFYGLRAGAVDTEGVRYRHELADIETLNRRALRGELAVTAISFHAYASLADRYVLLPHGASFGDGYGPCVVARRVERAPKTLTALAGRKVAVPGALTSAALALRLYAPAADPVVIPFDKVGDAVLRGEVDAGVVIHEGQLTWQDEGFDLVADLGVVWKEETTLPLPLGGNAVRKDLGPELIGTDLAWARPLDRVRARPPRGGAHRRDALRARTLPREGRPLRRDVRERLDPRLRRTRARGGAPLPRARLRGGRSADRSSFRSG